MRYVTSTQQEHVFRKEGFLELEAFFTEEELSFLKTGFDQALAKRLKKSVEQIPASSKKERLNAGFDLHRQDPLLWDKLHFKQLAQVGSFLFKETRLRFGFMQYYPCFDSTTTLKELSFVSEVCGGMLLSLTSAPLPQVPYFPKAFGSLICLSSELMLDFSLFDLPLLLIVFTKENSRYLFKENHPHAHALKTLGYAFGDLLTKETHPLLVVK